MATKKKVENIQEEVNGLFTFHDDKTITATLLIGDSTRNNKSKSTVLVSDGQGGSIAVRSTVKKEEAPAKVLAMLGTNEFSGTQWFTFSTGATNRWIKNRWTLTLNAHDGAKVSVAYAPGVLDVEARDEATQNLVNALVALDAVQSGNADPKAEKAALDAVNEARSALVERSQWLSEKGSNPAKGWSTELLTGPTVEIHDEHGVLRVTPMLRRGFALRVDPKRWEFSYAATYKRAVDASLPVLDAADETSDEDAML